MKPNAEIAAAFDELGDLYELDGAVSYRVIAYRTAAKSVRDASVSVMGLTREGKVTSLPGTAIVRVTSEDGSTTKTYTVGLVPLSVSTGGDVGGTVPATLGLTLGGPASFGAFTPGATKTYSASTTANVVSTAGDALLSVSDPDTAHPGHLVNGSFFLAQPLQVKATKADTQGTAFNDLGATPLNLLTWSAPVSNEPVTIAFQQSIGANEGLRTGSYAKTLTFTLSTTQP